MNNRPMMSEKSFEREMRSSAPVNPPRVRSTPFLESQTVVPSQYRYGIAVDHASDDRRRLPRPCQQTKSVCRNIIAVVVTVPGVETTPRAPFVRVPCEVSAARRAFFREESPATRASRGHAALVRLNPAWSRFVLADARRLGPPPRAVPSTSPPPPSR